MFISETLIFYVLYVYMHAWVFSKVFSAFEKYSIGFFFFYSVKGVLPLNCTGKLAPLMQQRSLL